DGDRFGVYLADQREHHVPALEEERVEDLVLGSEVVVDEAIGHACLIGDVRHPACVKALAREHAHGRIEDHTALVRGLGARSRRSPRAHAGTPPRGSRTMERPPECWPRGCSPTWLAAIPKAWFSIARARSSGSQ